MRTLVIGGTEFMGRRIVEFLVERGHDVTVLHRRESHDLGCQVSNLQADRADFPLVAHLLGGGRSMPSSTWPTTGRRAPPPPMWRPPREIAAIDSSVTCSCPASPPTRRALASVRAMRSCRTTSRDPYALHKASAERLLFGMHQASGFPVVTFRPPFVHGPRQPFYREQFFWDRLFDGRPIVLPDGGDAPTQWVFVDDVATACVRAIDVPEAWGEAFNIGHVEPLTQRSFVEALARVAGIEPRFASVPRATIRAAGGQLMGDSIYFGDYLDLPPRTALVEKAARVLDVTPTPLEAALGQGFAWYQAQPRRPVDYTFEDRLIAGA